jgi:hypothetical protein
MALKPPCLNCLNRHEACHSKCELYINYKKENDKLKEEINKQHELEHNLFIFRNQKYKRLNKRR